MGLVDEIVAGPGARVPRVSRFDMWLTELFEDERAAVLAAMDDPAWTNRQLRDVFARHGLTTSVSSVASYRRDVRGDTR